MDGIVLNDDQKKKAAADAADKMKKVSEAEAKRLGGIAEEVISILAKRGVTVSEMDIINRTIGTIVNNKINNTQLKNIDFAQAPKPEVEDGE